MPNGLFITFEGVDGCGKSTQMQLLAEHLASRGHSLLTTREPGGPALSEKIRTLLLDVENAEMCCETEALLYAAARVQHIEEEILPALEAGKIVLCDRYLDSSLAYQGYGRNLGLKTVLEMNRFAVERCMPDLTLFFDIDAEAAFARCKAREPDRLESGGDEFFLRTYQGFLALLERYPERIRRIDVSGTKFETHERLCLMIDRLLEQRNAL